MIRPEYIYKDEPPPLLLLEDTISMLPIIIGSAIVKDGPMTIASGCFLDWFNCGGASISTVSDGIGSTVRGAL